MTRYIGDIRVDRVIEHEGPDFVATKLLADATPAALDPHRHWLEPRFLDPTTQQFVLAMQTYVLRTARHTILVDTCVGNDKHRRFHAPWNQRTDPTWLDNLAAAGVRLEEVDFVMCTHLHPDHVGWNTRLVDGRWVPTFPNARYVFARAEFEYWEALNRKGAKYSDGCIGDSVLPVVEAGRSLLVDADYQFDDALWFEPTHGHTPGHIAIRLASKGASAVLSGDVIHSPVQCAHPEWSAVGCFDKELSRVTRRAFLERCCESDTLVMTAHFPSPSVGYVERAGNAFSFRFVPEAP
jgi:glyoxylase-like metal-dependent hydrolase (beta-lactamase superfamily II)